MRRDAMSAPLCLLLSGLLLMACGGSEAVPTVSEEPLGTGEAALCSGVGVSLSISGASTYQGELAASGSWSTSGGANAVRLEYYIDGTLYASEERVGTSGTWYFSTTGIACGSRAFVVKAFPMVVDSAGNRTTCWAVSYSTSKTVTEACPVSYTWQLMAVENCYDITGGSCYSRLWTPSCPTAPNGKSCSVYGDTCWYVKSSSIVEEYVCQ